MPRNAGAAIDYGKIKIATTEGDLKDCTNTLNEIMRLHGYPELETEYTDEDFQDLLDDEMDEPDESENEPEAVVQPPWERAGGRSDDGSS